MSFIRLFDGDLDLSNFYPGQNLTPNISDKIFSSTPLKIYGFNDLAKEANGNYFLNGEECNCYPTLEKSVSSSSATLTNSSNFFNADTFYYFRSPSIKSNQSYDSLFAHPDFFKIVEDSSKFTGHSHYINFLLDTNKDKPDTTAYFIFIFDDEENSFKKKYLNYNLSEATLTLSYLFSSLNERSFSTGLLFKQSNNFFTLDFGLTSSSSSPGSFSSSKVVSSSTFTLLYGESGSTLDLSGKTPYEVGVYFKDSASGDYRGLATNFKLQINGLTEKKYYIFNKDNKTVISDTKCSDLTGSNYIYANESINSHRHHFKSSNGSSPLFTDQNGYAINYGIEKEASPINIKNSDADATLDSKDIDPYGRQGASYSILTENMLSSSGVTFESKIDFLIEGFKYSYDGTDTDLTSNNGITDIPSMFQYISTLINSKSSETGIRSDKYALSDDMIFWRPKGGPSVSGYCLVYLAETIKLPIESTTDDYYITPTP